MLKILEKFNLYILFGINKDSRKFMNEIFNEIISGTLDKVISLKTIYFCFNKWIHSNILKSIVEIRKGSLIFLLIARFQQYKKFLS